MTSSFSEQFKCKYKDVSVSQDHSLILCDNGKVFGFGWNGHGRLGVGTLDVIHSEPVWMNQENIQNSTVTAISAGLEHGIALTRDNKIFVWGNKANGALGTGCEEGSTLTPRQLQFPDQVVDIDASRFASFLVTAKGNLFMFGKLDNERICTPKEIQLRQDVKYIFPGGNHVLILTKDGTLFSYGSNQRGQLGVGDAKPYSNVVRPDLPSSDEVIEASAGLYHSLALTKSGKVYFFGSEIPSGDGTLLSRWTPKLIDSIEEKTAWIVTGTRSSFLYTRSNVLYSWGSNNFQTLASGDSAPKLLPEPVEESFMRKSFLVTMDCARHCIAITTNNLLLGWGTDAVGQLGQGNKTYNELSKVSEIGLKTYENIKGMYGTVIVQNTKTMLTGFGRNSFGTLGDGTIIQKSEPIPIATDIFANKVTLKDYDVGDHALLLLSNNELWAFGNNNKKQTYKYGAYRNLPARIFEEEFNNITLENAYVGMEHSLVLSSDRKRLFAWGGNDYGQLGANLTAPFSSTPVEVLLPKNFVVKDFSPGYYHNLVIGNLENESEQILLYWGRGNFGAENSSISFFAPVQVNTTGENYPKFTSLCCTEDACLLGANTKVFIHFSGEQKLRKLEFLEPLTENEDIKRIECGANHYLLLSSKGRVFGYGDNQLFKLGYNSVHSVITSIVPSNMFTQAAAGGEVIEILCNLDNSYVVVKRTKIVELVLISIAAVICTILICACIFGVLFGAYLCGKRRQIRISQQRDQDLKRQLLNGVTNDDDELNFDLNVDKSLFEIPFESLTELTEIGVGGSGAIVYRAKYNNDMVAVKLFNPQAFEGTQDYEKFSKEVKLLASLRHYNIVNFFGAVLVFPRVGLVTEYCPKGNLGKLITKEKLSWKARVSIIHGIAKGMAFLHSKGIIHRDLKSDNILIDKDYNAKISDFDIATKKKAVSARHTTYVGTSYYMAPEVTLAKPYNEKCDVFSFSMIMFEMYVNKLDPFGANVPYVELKIAQNPNFRPKLDSSITRYPNSDWFLQLMCLCWNENPELRPSFDEINSTLDQARSEMNF